MALAAAAYASQRNKRAIGNYFSVSTAYGHPPPQYYVAPPPQVDFTTSNRRFPPPPSTARSLFSLVISILHELRCFLFIILFCSCLVLYTAWSLPAYPKIEIKSVTLHSSNNTWDIDLSVVNPNEKRSISYRNVEMQIEYGHVHENESYALRGRARLPDFYQDNKVNRSTVIRAEVLGVRPISSLEVLNVTLSVSVRYSARCSPLFCQSRLGVECRGMRLGISKATSDVIGGPCECNVH